LAMEQLVVLCKGRGRTGHNRSVRRINSGNSETKTPTRKPDVWGTPLHLLTWCPGHRSRRVHRMRPPDPGLPRSC
jgi:hypothetical protein